MFQPVAGPGPPRLGRAIVAAYTGKAELGDIFEALEDAELPRWQLPKDLKHLADFPTTGPGKIDRRAGAARGAPFLCPPPAPAV